MSYPSDLPWTPPSASKRRKLILTRMWLFLIGILLIVLGVLYVHYGMMNPGPFDRGLCEAVVARVRQQQLQPQEVTDFRLDDPSDPKSLRRLKPGEVYPGWHGAGLVWAKLSADGNLIVEIKTRDYWHFGQFGFAYSSKPMTPEYDEDDRKWYLYDLPVMDEASPDMKINEHWWKVETSGD